MNHFFDIRRLVHRDTAEVADQGTFALMTEFRKLDAEATRLRDASWFTAPGAALARTVTTVTAVDAAARARWMELMRRYEGMVLQMLRKAGVKAGDMKGLVPPIYSEALVAFRAMADRRMFPVALWRAFERVVGSADADLKAKVMLRAFVDELPSSDERGMLRLVAYAGASRPAGPTMELKETMRRGCVLLHREVTALGIELDRLTGGAIEFAKVDGWTDDQVQEGYEAWLMAAP